LTLERREMWYFTWILGLGFALAAGVISVMWLETTYALGGLDEGKIEDRFGKTGGAQS
jgi:cyd operon protein YbgT